jgi:hypothetical protein
VLVVHHNGDAVALTVSRDAAGRVVVIANPAVERRLLLDLAQLTLEAAPLAELTRLLDQTVVAGAT